MVGTSNVFARVELESICQKVVGAFLLSFFGKERDSYRLEVVLKTFFQQNSHKQRKQSQKMITENNNKIFDSIYCTK